jgi:hypothetical protein
MSGVPSVVNLKPRTLLTVFWDAFTRSGKSLSVDDNYRCSKGLQSTRARSHQDGADLQLTSFRAFGCAAPMATHSITSSARASRAGGTSRPSAFAVVKLMTSSNLVGCTTGNSAGLAPLRTLPA